MGIVVGWVYRPPDDDNALEYGGSFYACPQMEWEYLATVDGIQDNKNGMSGTQVL
jgi:hypothetical protein